MADAQVRNLDDAVASALKARASERVSLQEEVRRTLTASVAADREELVRRAKVLHAAAGGKPGNPELDSARIIRAERQCRGMRAALSRSHGWRVHGRHQSA
jgi:plasmid stability protein